MPRDEDNQAGDHVLAFAALQAVQSEPFTLQSLIEDGCYALINWRLSLRITCNFVFIACHTANTYTFAYM